MSELSRYSVRILSETKPSDRTRKCPITLCLGEKVSFYFIKISHSYYHLPSRRSILFTFFAFVTVTSVCLSHRGLHLFLETLQRNVYFSGVLTLNTHSCSGEFEASDSSKYSSTTPYCARRSAAISRFNIEYRMEELLIIFSSFEVL